MDPTPVSYLLCQQHIFSSEVLFIKASAPSALSLKPCSALLTLNSAPEPCPACWGSLIWRKISPCYSFDGPNIPQMWKAINIERNIWLLRPQDTPRYHHLYCHKKNTKIRQMWALLWLHCQVSSLPCLVKPSGASAIYKWLSFKWETLVEVSS